MNKTILSVIFLMSFSVAASSDKTFIKKFCDVQTVESKLNLWQPTFIKTCQTMYPYMYQYKQRAVCYAMFGFQALLSQASKRK